MFIHHFNRLIRNKWVWGVFAVLISAFFAFDFLIPNDRGGAGANEAGTLDGDVVKADEFRAYAGDIRGYGRMQRNEMSETEVNKAAWENLAAARVAERLGLGAFKEEVREEILNERYFQGASGSFDMSVYERMLLENGLNPELFEQMRMRATAIQKISREVVLSASWVAPMELDRALDDMTDEFTVRVATFADKSEAPKLDDAALMKYYESHTNSLALPDLVTVRYLKFEANDPARYSKLTVSDDELHDYYDTVGSRYETQTTNGVVRKTLEEVKPELLKELQQIALLEVFTTNLPFRVYAQDGAAASTNKQPSKLDVIAAEEKMTVRTSPRFGTDDARVVRDLMVSAKSFAPGTEGFAATAFELDPEVEEMRYGIVRGTNCVYLIERASFVKAHVPTFEEAKASIRQPATTEAKNDAFKAAVNKVADAAREALKGGKAFDPALFGDANVSTSITFSVSTMSWGAFPDAGAVSGAARKLAKGELSEFTPSGSGRAVVVFMENRKPGDAASAQMFASQLRDRLAMTSAGDLIGDWKSWNLKRLGFAPESGFEAEDAVIGEDDDDAGELPEE